MSAGTAYLSTRARVFFNGDIGIIRQINDYAHEVVVEFDEHRRVTYAYAQLDEIELAYAVTIHKSQGSEYPAVIMPLLTGPKMLFNRNLLYTGVTRARNCVTILGSRPDPDREWWDQQLPEHALYGAG